MKRIFTLLLSVVALAATTFTAQAEDKGFGDLVDLGAMQLDTDYTLAGDFSDYIGSFTATESGTLVATGTNSTIMDAFYANLSDMFAEGNQIPVNYDNYYGTKQYHFDVTAGTTYYFYASFVMSNCVFRLTMDTNNSVEIASIKPSLDDLFSVSAGGLVTIQFNRSVHLDGTATIIAGSENATVAINGQANIYTMEIKVPLFNWLENGTLKGGDTFTIRLTNVRASDNDTIVYGTDGTLELVYTINEMPVKLSNSTNTTGAFKSYYMPGDESGIVQLTFSGDISTATASLSFGNTDVEGDYYVENLKPVIEGNTITVDLTGKQRTPELMVASGTNYDNMTLSFNGVMGVDGQLAYSEGDGTLGGFSFTYSNLDIVTAEVFSDFVPASGSSLDNVTELEIWIADEVKLQYEGVLFKYINPNDTQDYREVVTYNDQITKEVDPDDANAAILYVPIPQVLNGTWTVVVTLYNLTSADGLDHSGDVRAEYHMGDAAIDNVFGDETSVFTVFNAKGMLVLTTTNRDAVKNLPAGIYIINGEKFLLTR